jgi:hypothetical protein
VYKPSTAVTACRRDLSFLFSFNADFLVHRLRWLFLLPSPTAGSGRGGLVFLLRLHIGVAVSFAAAIARLPLTFVSKDLEIIGVVRTPRGSAGSPWTLIPYGVHASVPGRTAALQKVAHGLVRRVHRRGCSDV